MNAYLQALAESPIDTAARANKVWLPEGRRSAPKSSKKVAYEGDFGGAPLKPSQVRERAIESHSAKIVAILDYYATTEVPFERIADHTKLSLEDVGRAMTRRGRAA